MRHPAPFAPPAASLPLLGAMLYTQGVCTHCPETFERAERAFLRAGMTSAARDAAAHAIAMRTAIARDR